MYSDLSEARLWAWLYFVGKRGSGNHYTIDHFLPVERILRSLDIDYRVLTVYSDGRTPRKIPKLVFSWEYDCTRSPSHQGCTVAFATEFVRMLYHLQLSLVSAPDVSHDTENLLYLSFMSGIDVRPGSNGRLKVG